MIQCSAILVVLEPVQVSFIENRINTFVLHYSEFLYGTFYMHSHIHNNGHLAFVFSAVMAIRQGDHSQMCRLHSAPTLHTFIGHGLRGRFQNGEKRQRNSSRKV